jgi:hypothetical protein
LCFLTYLLLSRFSCNSWIKSIRIFSLIAPSVT